MKTVAISEPACKFLVDPLYKNAIGSIGTLGDVGNAESTMGSK